MARHEWAVMGGILVLTVGLTPAASADSRVARIPEASIHGNGGFRFERQRILPDGRVVTRYRSKDGTVDTIGRPGTDVTIGVSVEAPSVDGTAHGSIEIAFGSPSMDKRATDLPSRRTPGAVESLIELGVDPAVARREFVAAASLTGASATPWDTQCVNLSYADGKITGRGCATIYLTAANGTDWWFETKMTVTASSSDTSLFPVRVKGLGWKLGWTDPRNQVVEWDPSSTKYGANGCSDVSLGGSRNGFSISLMFSLCPTKEIPWDVTQTSSGALWFGVERDTDPVGAAAVQKDHNPPSATTGHVSTFSLSY